MKLTNLELTGSFIPALQELAAQKTSVDVASNVVDTFTNASKAVESFEAKRKTLIEARCEKNEDGSPKTDGKDYVFASDEVKQEVVGLIEELAKTEIELEIFPIKKDDLKSVPISAAVMLSLKDFITRN